jgi:hypothetical protein
MKATAVLQSTFSAAMCRPAPESWSIDNPLVYSTFSCNEDVGEL